MVSSKKTFITSELIASNETAPRASQICSAIQHRGVAVARYLRCPVQLRRAWAEPAEGASSMLHASFEIIKTVVGREQQ
jgi:Tfp pilus assembly protein FimT